MNNKLCSCCERLTCSKGGIKLIETKDEKKERKAVEKSIAY